MIMRIWMPPLADLRPDAPLEFEVLDGRRRVQRRADAVIGELPRGMNCELLLHPFDVLLVGVSLPRLTGAKLASALPGLVEEYVAGLFEMSPAHVHEVVTFYTLFFQQPTGRHVVSVCHNLSCHLLGSKSIVEHLTQRLGVEVGETTVDGRITLLVPSEATLRSSDRPLDWKSYATSVDVRIGPANCDGDTMLKDPSAATFARHLGGCLADSVAGVRP